MSPIRCTHVDWRQDDEGPHVVELDGPCAAYFEIPLDYFATPNGELEPESHPEASRLTQRVVYQAFNVADTVRVRTATERVRARLQAIGGGYIWWRRRPTQTADSPPRMRFRLGTTPELPTEWWQELARAVESSAQIAVPPKED